jgi:hypothetical protein
LKDNEMDLKEIGCEDVCVYGDRVHWQTFFEHLNEPLIVKKGGEFLD